MSAITAANQINASRANPPLDYSKKAIINHLRHQATNGPAYVQLGATKALARFIGLYDDAKIEAKRRFSEAANHVSEKSRAVSDRVKGLLDGTIQATQADLGNYAIALAAEPGQQDEQDREDPEDKEGSHDEEEPP